MIFVDVSLNTPFLYLIELKIKSIKEYANIPMKGISKKNICTTTK